MSKPKKLSAKRAAFVREYLKDLNATQAAIRAGYSAATATKAASRMLTFVDVAAAIAEAQQKAAERNDISVDRVLREYARIAFANITDFYEFGPKGVTLKASTALSPDSLAAVMEVTERKTIDEEGRATAVVRLKLHNKINALTALAQHLGMGAHDAKLQAIVQEMLESARARMTAEAYAQLVRIIAAEMGIGGMAPGPARADEHAHTSGGDLH